MFFGFRAVRFRKTAKQRGLLSSCTFSVLSSPCGRDVFLNIFLRIERPALWSSCAATCLALVSNNVHVCVSVERAAAATGV